MSILKNFVNPWEADRGVLESDVLDTSVLQNDVLSNLSSNDFELDTDDNQNFNLGNLYKKGTDERFIYSKQIRAFELFVSSTTGKDWFKSRVNKGFVFTPFFYKSGAFVAKENGYHYNKRIRTKLFITDIGKKLKAEGSTDIVTIAGADGLTRAKIKDNNLHVTIYLNSDNTNQSKDKIKIMYAVDTWVHEILLHGELFENIFIKQNRLASNAEAAAEHNQTDIDKSSYEKQILKILIHARDTIGMSNYTDEMLKTYFKGL